MASNTHTPDPDRSRSLTRFANWKVAVAGGALLGVGSATVLGATVGATPVESEPISAVTAAGQNTSNVRATVASLRSPARTTVTLPPTSVAPSTAASTIGREEAVAIALAATPGVLVEAGLIQDGTRSVWEVYVRQADGRIIESYVDAVSGRIVEQELQTPAPAPAPAPSWSAPSPVSPVSAMSAVSAASAPSALSAPSAVSALSAPSPLSAPSAVSVASVASVDSP